MDEQTKMGQEQVKKVAKAALQMLDGVTTVANVRGISNAELEAVYNVGFAAYGTGKFDDAEKVFTFLCHMCHTNPKYWTALGSVRQAKRNFADAIKAYSAATLFNINKPKPYYYAAECSLALGDLEDAENTARALLTLCPAGTADNNDFRAKAELLIKKIETARKTA